MRTEGYTIKWGDTLQDLLKEVPNLLQLNPDLTTVSPGIVIRKPKAGIGLPSNAPLGGNALGTPPVDPLGLRRGAFVPTTPGFQWQPITLGKEKPGQLSPWEMFYSPAEHPTIESFLAAGNERPGGIRRGSPGAGMLARQQQLTQPVQPIQPVQPFTVEHERNRGGAAKPTTIIRKPSDIQYIMEQAAKGLIEKPRVLQFEEITSAFGDTITPQDMLNAGYVQDKMGRNLWILKGSNALLPAGEMTTPTYYGGGGYRHSYTPKYKKYGGGNRYSSRNLGDIGGFGLVSWRVEA